MADDETVSNFMAITACQDADTAVSYLEMSGNNLDTAVGLFMEHSANLNDGGGASANAAAASSSSSAAAGLDGVRAPDRTVRETLVGGVPSLDHALPGLLMRGRDRDAMMMDDAVMRSAFADDPDDDVVVVGDEDEDGVRVVGGSVRDRVNRAAAAAGAGVESGDDHDNNGRRGGGGGGGSTELANMFAPPNRILHRAGGFQGARAVARDSRRWLLVNLQRDSEFSCHALNRDVWANDLVENLIVSSFIFWQAMDDSEHGALYAQRYNVVNFPHVAIIDPRTARLVWKKEGWTQEKPMTAEEFAQKAADFCSLHSFDAPPSATKQGGIKPKRSAKRPVEDLSEQEQLAKAIRESQGINDSMDTEDDDEEDDHAMTNGDEENCGGDDDGEVLEVPPPPKPPAEPTFDEEIRELKVGEEPSEGGARLQFRMPDGGRVVRRFRSEDEVKIIYAFVAQSNDEAKAGKAFVLRAGFPPKDLIDKVKETIGNCSLSGESVTVRWK